jgi:CubicO group peptidase (beta-lactamase class C family)
MRMKLFIYSLSVTLSLSLPAFVATGQQTDRTKLVSEIDAIANDALKQGPIAGMSVAVMRDGSPIIVKGYGMANLESNSPATADTVYRIRSISKTFTAVAVLQLVEQGKVSLDEDLSKFVSDFPTHGQSIKVRHLLSHTSGVKTYGGPSWRKNKRLDLSPIEWLALVKDEPPDFPPGTNYNYSNAGYDLLALIIEKASGETYPDYIRKHIAEPLGLKVTGYCTNTAIIKNRAAPYEVAKGRMVNADAWGNYGYGSAMVCSTATELVKFQQALNEHRILSPASVSLMREGVRISDGPAIGRGFGTHLGDLDGHPMIGHSGDGGGWTSALAYYPADRLTIVVLTNTENDNDPNFLHADRLQTIIARSVLNLPPRPPTNKPLSISEAQNYVGDWGVPKAQIFLDGEILKVKPPGFPGNGLKMLYQGEHTFAIEGSSSDTRLKFVIEGAQANWVLIYNNGYFTALAKRQR